MVIPVTSLRSRKQITLGVEIPFECELAEHLLLCLVLNKSVLLRKR